jgi:heparanase
MRVRRVPPMCICMPHCLRGVNGGVAVLAINTDSGAAHELAIPLKADRYTLTAKDTMDNKVDLNGSELKLTAGGDVPVIKGAPAASGVQSLPGASISFFAIPQANNGACKSAR